MVIAELEKTHALAVSTAPCVCRACRIRCTEGGVAQSPGRRRGHGGTVASHGLDRWARASKASVYASLGLQLYSELYSQL